VAILTLSSSSLSLAGHCWRCCYSAGQNFDRGKWKKDAKKIGKHLDHAADRLPSTPYDPPLIECSWRRHITHTEGCRSHFLSLEGVGREGDARGDSPPPTPATQQSGRSGILWLWPWQWLQEMRYPTDSSQDDYELTVVGDRRIYRQRSSGEVDSWPAAPNPRTKAAMDGIFEEQVYDVAQGHLICCKRQHDKL
jgi:hypothetical protein